MSDVFLKRIEILKAIPAYPARISASDIQKLLLNEGFDVHKRTIQRDLKDLEKSFPIGSDGNKDIPGWSWQVDATKLELPGMIPSVALTFQMVKSHLQKYMPPCVLKDLEPYFSNSEKLLSTRKQKSFTEWNGKVAMLSRTQPLLAPQVNNEILTKIYSALLNETQIKAHYQPKLEEPRDYIINPLGVVIVDQIIYLVGTLWEYKDVKQFALHRFISVEKIDTAIYKSKPFDLQTYIDNSQFYFPISDQEKTIELKLKTNKWIAKHLEETALSENQIITQIVESDLFEITATVENTQQLQWWLQGFGSGVEVLEPQALRNEFKEISEKLHTLYQ